MLQFINRCGTPALELTKNSPALAFLVANRRQLDCELSLARLDVVRRLLRERQREIAVALGFPDRESTAKILKKVATTSVGKGVLMALKRALDDEDARRLMSRLPRLNARTIWIASEAQLRSLVSVQFLEGLCQEGPWDFSTFEVFELRQTSELAERLRVTLPTITRFQQLRSIHEALTECALDICPEGGSLPGFPSPPFPDDVNIRAISTAEDLLSEGIEMHHCVGSYVWDVAHRSRYFYKMNTPRATICLRLWGCRWSIEEIRGKRNARMETKVVQDVEAWLDQVQSNNKAWFSKQSEGSPQLRGDGSSERILVEEFNDEELADFPLIGPEGGRVSLASPEINDPPEWVLRDPDF